MGQKVHPLGFRLGVSQKHISHWFIENNHYSDFVVEDEFIRNFFYKKFPGIASINIQRDINRVVVEILSANARDLAMDGVRMTAKATVPSSSNSKKQGNSNQVSSSQGSPLLEEKSAITLKASSRDNLCEQLLKQLTAFRNTRLKKTYKANRIDNRDRVSTSSSQARNNTDAVSQEQGNLKIESRPAQASASTKSASTKSKLFVDPDESSLSVQPGNSAVHESRSSKASSSHLASPVHDPTELNPATESSMIQKTVEVELFWTKVENPNTSAACLAEFIVEQLEKRVPFRRVLKRSIQKAEEASVSGIKVQISGRLNGAEIARSERIHKGRVPLHTLRAKIEYNSRTAKTIYGLLGVKVWVFNGFADLNQTKLLT